MEAGGRLIWGVWGAEPPVNTPSRLLGSLEYVEPTLGILVHSSQGVFPRAAIFYFVTFIIVNEIKLYQRDPN